MSSVLSYRFNSSSKVWLQFPFEGGSITPNEFKRAVMKKLIPNAPSDKDTPGEQAGNVLQDFELQVFNDQTGEEYYGDMMSIPKNTQLVVKRVPNYRTKTLRLEAGGKQAAQDALEGYGTNTGVRLSSSAFDLPPSKRLNFGPGASVDEFGEDPLDESTYLQREEERRAQVAKERAAQLAAAIATATAKAAEAAQALATTPNAPTPSTMHAPMVAPGVRPPPSRPPPPGYICHNCRQGGHWKQLCPTAAHLSAPKVSMPLVQQATTGNVLSLLGLATRAPGAAAAILSAYTNRGVTNPSVTVAPNGSVIVTPSTAPVVAPLPAPPQPPQPTIPSDLTCTICHRLFTQPMVVPCCFTSFCEECIKQALVMDPSCPRCRSTDVSADQLRKNNVLARRAEQERSKLNQSQSIPQPLPQQPAMSHAAHYPPPQKMAAFDGDDYSVQRR